MHDVKRIDKENKYKWRLRWPPGVSLHTNLTITPLLTRKKLNRSATQLSFVHKLTKCQLPGPDMTIYKSLKNIFFIYHGTCNIDSSFLAYKVYFGIDVHISRGASGYRMCPIRPTPQTCGESRYILSDIMLCLIIYLFYYGICLLCI